MSDIAIVIEPGTDREHEVTATTPENAVYAARFLLREALGPAPIMGYDPAAAFYVGGNLVRRTTLRALQSAFNVRVPS